MTDPNEIDPEREYPELTCRDDPFVAEAVKGDDLADDLRYNFEWMNLSAAEGEREARKIEALRDAFEITTLNRWYGLPPPVIA